MATTTDRPRQKKPAQLEPAAKPPTPPQGPLWTRGPRGQPEPNRRRDRLLACLWLFGPAVVLLLGALAVIAVVLVLTFGGSGEAPPATGAAQLVPGNALLYLHVSTDPSRPAVRRALVLSRRLTDSPLLFAAVTTRLDALLGGSAAAPIDFSTDVRPWLGNEAALAVLDTPGVSAGTLVVLDVRDREAARRFLARVGAQPDGRFRGVALFTQGGGTTLAFVRHYLVLGQAASVESAIYVSDGRAPSLATSSAYERAASGEPAGRVLDAYASAVGISRALAPRADLLGDLGYLLDQPGPRAAAVSVSATRSALQIEVHSSLGRGRARRSVEFSPSLPSVLPAHSMLLLDATNLRTSLPKLLAVAARAGILGRIAPLLARLGGALSAEGVDVRQVLGVFSGESAIAITPGVGGHGPVPVIVTRTANMASTRVTLAGLEGPLTQLFTPASGPGQVPQVTQAAVAGVPVREVPLEPGFDLDYTVAHGLVVISTGLPGVGEVLKHPEAMDATASFSSAVADDPSRVTSLVFFDLSQLLRLGEQTGFIGSARQATLPPAAENIHAVGLESWRGADETTTKIQLQIP